MATNEKSPTEDRKEEKKATMVNTLTVAKKDKTLPKINIEQTVLESIVPQTLEEKPIPKSTLKYYELPFKYNYGTKEHPNLSDFLFEGPKFKSTRGLVMKEFNGKPSWSIMQYLPDKDPVMKAFKDALTKIYYACGFSLSKVKGAVGIREFDFKNPSATGFKNPISFPTDKEGNIIEGKDPFIYFKIIKTYDQKTLFTEIDVKKEIRWELLQNVEMEYIPLFHLEKIYIGGGKASLQMKMKSAIVTSIQGKNTSSNQVETAARLKEEDPDAEMSLKDQIAQLMLQRQDELENNTKKTESSVNKTDGGPKITPLDPTNVDIANFFKSTQ